ncbi:hypothetical protein [Clostridium sp.]|uniref:hypothetical protein n=1 Tax=Clostridium sp. TaxID=1506 RepID=UPI001D853299|nr:hypothetical protein [Clostridium sp.]MBS5307710.1 hypothetical protein [Clostridium sp.]
MVIDGAWKNKVFRLWKEKKCDLAKEEVFKFRMRYYNKLERIEDKIFLDYRMAYHEYLDKNIELANVYFESLEHIFKDDYVRESCEYEYYSYIWLYINNNEENLTDEYKIKEMIEIYNYYKSNSNDGVAITALQNISKLQGNQEKILENLKSLLDSEKIREWSLVESILKDCEKISSNLYIKALQIVNEYRININVV